MGKHANEGYLSPEELSFFCGQIALMLESGLPLHESMDVLYHNYAHTRYEGAFRLLNERMQAGGQLKDAMEESKIFPPYAVKMTAVGDVTGKLEPVMHGLSVYYERESNMRVSIRNAIRYPIALMAIMAVVVVILNARVLPLFDQVFRNLGTDVSAATRTAMNAGTVIGLVVLLLVLAILLAAAACAVAWRFGKKQWLLSLAGRLSPGLRRIQSAITAERFLMVLSIALSAGYPSQEAVGMCAELMENPRDARRVKTIVDKADEGLSDAIQNSGLLDPLKARMVQVGFLTGRADTVVGHVAQLYEQEIDERIDRALTLIEPTLVSVLAVIIGCILLTVMLPLAGVMSAFL